MSAKGIAVAILSPACNSYHVSITTYSNKVFTKTLVFPLSPLTSIETLLISIIINYIVIDITKFYAIIDNVTIANNCSRV